jgi:putative transcriptional regulator
VAGPLAGRLVVATHDLAAPAFRRTVVLVLSHEPSQGAAGVVLNRPTEMAPPGALARWTTVAAAPAVLFRGGPVGPGTVIGVTVAHGDRAAIDGWQQVLGPLGVLDLGADPALARPHVDGVRMFAGYAGWSAGQLEQEIESGAWFVVGAEPSDVLTVHPTALWRAVLARQGGLFSTVPVDPDLN